MEIRIPDLGDIEEVEVIEIVVAPGDQVQADDTILVIESDKASMDVPAPQGGTIASIEVEVGAMVGTGHLIAVLEASEEGAGAEEGEEASQVAQENPPPAEPVEQGEGAQEAAPQSGADAATSREVEVRVPDVGDAASVVVIEIAVTEGDEVAADDLLVVLESDKASMELTAEQAGTVVKVAVSQDQEVVEGTHVVTMVVQGGETAAGAQAASTPTPVADADTPKVTESTSGPVVDSKPSTSSPATSEESDAARIYAGPAVRRLARELGVELSQVTGTGNRNRITKADVKAHVKQTLTAGGGSSGGGLTGWPLVDVGDPSKFGEVEMVALSRIQQSGARNLHRSWVNLPHVTQHNEADITEMEAFRKSLKQEAERKGVKLTPLAFLIKACCAALAEYPNFNASLHPDGKQLYVKKYVNIGMAVDTPEGLVVPVIKSADQKSIWELCEDIEQLSDKARNKKLGLGDLQGGTFSISSLGALGGTGFTPIVNAPEVAILGVAKMQTKPVWDGEQFQPAKVLPLSLSYDHRVINGADGGRFMVFLSAVLEDIRRLVL